MVTHPGKLLTHRWLLARVWGDQHGDESRQALRTHIRSLRSKIGDDAGTPSYLRTESGAGYRWLPEPQRSENGDGTQAEPAGPAAPQAAVGSRAVALHDINNVLTALHLSLHVALDGTGRLAADGSTRTTSSGSPPSCDVVFDSSTAPASWRRACDRCGTTESRPRTSEGVGGGSPGRG